MTQSAQAAGERLLMAPTAQDRHSPPAGPVGQRRVRQTLSPTRRPTTEGKTLNAHGRGYVGDPPLPVPWTIARWYELQWISQVFLGPHSHHLHRGSYLPLNKEKGGNLIFCLDNQSNQAEMTRSPQASVNAPTASGLKAISQELYSCIPIGDSMSQKAAGQ